MTFRLNDHRELRLWAARCGDQAKNPRIDSQERDRLLKMQAALIDLAAENEWLDGQRSYLEFNFSESGPVKSPAA